MTAIDYLHVYVGANSVSGLFSFLFFSFFSFFQALQSPNYVSGASPQLKKIYYIHMLLVNNNIVDIDVHLLFP
jgi:hypothetical protein